MELGMRERVALVTGGSSGIGLACVELLLQEGARVVTCARDEARLESALRPLTAAYPGRLAWRVADVCEPEDVQRLVRFGESEFGQLDALVNNAGASRVSTFATTTDQDWRDEFGLKFGGVFNPLRAATDLLKQSDQAAVVNVNSVLARQPEPHLVATSAARAGLLNLSKSLAFELAEFNIRVNSVLVGLVDTGQWKRRYRASGSEQDFESWSHAIARDRGIALGRFGTAAEVAATIIFLTSSRSSYITGAAFDVAGGVNRYV